MCKMIMISFLLAAGCALGSTCSADAQTVYRCMPDGQVVAPPNRAVSFEIAIKPNGDFDSIIFKAADGTAYDRGMDFDKQNVQAGNNQHRWTGRLRTNPSDSIVGYLSREGDRLVYFEILSDPVLGTAQIISTCEPIVPQSDSPLSWTASKVFARL
jgi:hypothetical protein